MFKKLSSAMGKSSSFHSERKPPAPPPPQASPPGGSSDSDNFDSASSSADSLEGSVELTVVLPNGKTVFMSVEKRMPMMDLLIHVATSNKISPGSHVISVFNDGNKDAVTYTPSTPIGMLNTSVIYVVPKKNSENFMKKPTRMSSTQPFEHTFRLQVHLPRNQLLVLRVSQQIRLSDLHEMVCTQKGLDATRYALQHPLDPDLPLDYACSLADYNLTEINFMSKRSTIVPSYTSSELLDIGRDSTDEKKRKTVFGFVFRRSKSSLGDSSSDDRSSRGVSPTRSDGSGHQSLSPPLSSPPCSTSVVVKKRPAPLPPTATHKQRGEKPPPPPPFRTKSVTLSNYELEHTRTKSDSSVSLDRAYLGDSSEKYDLPVMSKKASAKIGAASSLSNLSTTSSTTSGVKKRRAPPPPTNVLSITSVVAADCHQQPSDSDETSPSAAISVVEDIAHLTLSTDALPNDVNTAVKPVTKHNSNENMGDHHNSNSNDSSNSISTEMQHHKTEVDTPTPNADNVEQPIPKEQMECKPVEDISAPIQQLISNPMPKINAHEEHNLQNSLQEISAEELKLESNTLHKLPIKDQQVESKTGEKISCKGQLSESNSTATISALEQQPEAKYVIEIAASDTQPIANHEETNFDPEQLQPSNDIEKNTAIDLQYKNNKVLYEQDQAISMVHEVFQDIDQEYSDEDEDSEVDKNFDDLITHNNFVSCKEVNLDKEDNCIVDHERSNHFATRVDIPITPVKDLGCDNHGISAKIMEMDTSVIDSPNMGKESDMSSELLNKEGGTSSLSSSVQPAVPSPTLPLSSVVSASVHPVAHHNCPEHLENACKLPVHCHPATSSSSEIPQNFNNNNVLPDHHKNPISDDFTLPIVNNSTLREELAVNSTVGSVLGEASVDMHEMCNKNVPDVGIEPRIHVGDPLPVPDCDPHHVGGDDLKSQPDLKLEISFVEPTTEIKFSLPDHHERAIQTSPVPDLQHFVLQQNIIAQQNETNTDGPKIGQQLDENSADPNLSHVINNSGPPKSIVQPKLNRVPASFSDEQKQYQWNDVLIGDSLQCTSIDDDWVSSCSEGEPEVIDTSPNVTNSNVAVPALTKGSTAESEIKRFSDHRSCKQMEVIDDPSEGTDMEEQKGFVAIKQNIDLRSSSEVEICNVSPVLVSHEVKEYRVARETVQEVTSALIKSKANTLPHNTTKVVGDASESELATKAATLPLNATRSSYTSESCPPAVPKFKRPLMNFSISTYKSRTEVDPAYETRLAKSESFSSQPVSQQVRESGSRSGVSRGSSFQSKNEGGKEQFTVSQADAEQMNYVRLRSNTLPLNQQFVLMRNNSVTDREIKASMGKSSSMTHLDDCDEAQIFRTHSVQNLEHNETVNDSNMPLPTEREEVLVLQQEYIKLQKQLLHWQQQLLSNQNLLQKQHILPEDAFQLSPDILLLKGSEESVKPVSLPDVPEPQLIETKHENEQNQIKASHGVQKSHSAGTYVKLQMCQPYKAKTDVHGKVKAPKQRPSDNVNFHSRMDPSDSVIRTTPVSIKSSYEQQFSEEGGKSIVVPTSRARFANPDSDVINMTAPARLAVLKPNDIAESRDVNPKSCQTGNSLKLVPVQKSKPDPVVDSDLEVNLPSVKDRVSMLFGKNSSNLHHSIHPAAKPLASGLVEKNSIRSNEKALKLESKPPALSTTAIEQMPYVEPDLPSRVIYSSFPVMSNVVGRRPVTAVSEKRSEDNQQHVFGEISAPTKNKFRRQRFEPAVLHSESNDSADTGAGQLNGNYPVNNSFGNRNTSKAVQFSITSSTDQQRKEWEAPGKLNKTQTVSASAPKSQTAVVNSRTHSNVQQNGERKNVTKVAINGRSTTVDQSNSSLSTSKSVPDSRNLRSAPFVKEVAFGKNSTAKAPSAAKKIPVVPVQQDPRGMLLEQIKNFGGRENLRDSRHRE